MMKKLFLTFLVITGLAIGTASAQFSRPITVGAGAGATYGLTDLTSSKINFAWYGEGDYLLSPFISVGLRAEKGELGGTSYGNEFSNKYYAGNVNAKLRMGKFMDLPENYSYFSLTANNLQRIISNIYIGAGAGLMKNRIRNSIDYPTRTQITTSGGEISTDLGGIHFIVPINLGVDIPFGRTLYGAQWAVNVNYQHTMTFNDNLDGIKYTYNDQYGFFSVGVKYAFFNRN